MSQLWGATAYTTTSGHTIYYEVTSTTATGGTVTIVPPTTYGWTGYTKPTGDLTIPSLISIRGVSHQVTAIANYAFYECTGITSVNIPIRVQSIGDRAFTRCYSLASVSMPRNSRSNLVSIGQYAFDECSLITTLKIPNTVTTIGRCAFGGVFNIQYTGTATPTTAGSIWGALSLNGYAEWPFHFTDTTKTVLKKMLVSITNVEVPGTVTTICDSAFMSVSYSNVTLPASLRTIGRYAFANHLTSGTLTVPDQVTTIGTNAFLNVLNLVYHGSATGANWGAKSRNGYVQSPWVYSDTSRQEVIYYAGSDASVTIPSYVTRIGAGTFMNNTTITQVSMGLDVTRVGNRAFAGCENLSRVRLPTGLTYIGDSAFYGCEGYFSFTVPSTVDTIGCYAFANNTSLLSITMPTALTRLGAGAFSGCSNLSSVDLPNTLAEIEPYVFYQANVSAFFIPNSVTRIGDYAFAYNSNANRLTIPNSVTSIGNYAFANCTNLATVTFGNSVATIGEYAFLSNTRLTSVTLPNSLVSLGDYAFHSCSGLQTVTLGSRLHSIGSGAFKYSGLRGIVVPNSVTSIGSEAFGYCNNLSSATFGDGVTSIPSNCCYGSPLTSLVLGKSVTSIGTEAFANNWMLNDVVSKAYNPPTLGTQAFPTGTSASVTVPCGRATAYRSSSWGSVFSSSGSSSYSINSAVVYTITVGTNDPAKGSVTRSLGTCSGSASVTAVPATGYVFRCWHDGNTQNPRSFTLTKDTTMVAIFGTSTTSLVTYDTVQNCNTRELTLQANKPAWGQCAGAGSYLVGSEVQILALPNEGYHFDRWNDGTTTNRRTITVTSDLTITAIFKRD